MPSCDIAPPIFPTLTVPFLPNGFHNGTMATSCSPFLGAHGGENLIRSQVGLACVLVCVLLVMGIWAFAQMPRPYRAHYRFLLWMQNDLAPSFAQSSIPTDAVVLLSQGKGWKMRLCMHGASKTPQPWPNTPSLPRFTQLLVIQMPAIQLNSLSSQNIQVAFGKLGFGGLLRYKTLHSVHTASTTFPRPVCRHFKKVRLPIGITCWCFCCHFQK